MQWLELLITGQMPLAVAARALFFAALGLFLHGIAFKLIRRAAHRTGTVLLGAIERHIRLPSRLLVPLFILIAALPGLQMPPLAERLTARILIILLIVVLAWLAIRAMAVLIDAINHRYDINAADNLQARKIHTQTRVLQRVTTFVISLFALAVMLMTIDSVRHVGMSLLASAGVVGVVVGFAAQRSLATLLAGIQLAITQPIRIDDVVIVEGEWGRIEEITLTYVVVRIWDLRRLIVPVNHFIDRAFQNWTRVSADLLGAVYLYTDYTVPIDELREALRKILAASPLWDGKVAVLQVTNATERTLELRALMSAANASVAWDLRCEVRERMIEYLRDHYPQALPRLRAEIDASG